MNGAVWCIVLAGGGGRRFGETADGAPKQFQIIDDDAGPRTLLQRVVATARQVVDGVIVVAPADHLDRARAQIETRAQIGTSTEVRVVVGGEQRADSVRAGLAAVPGEAEVVVVADAAHPLAGADLFARVVAAARRQGVAGAIPGIPLTEVVAEVGPGGVRTGTVAREGRVLVQTPQAFKAGALRAVHAEGAPGVEDSGMVAAAGGVVVVVEGDVRNVHVTTIDELALVRALARSG